MNWSTFLPRMGPLAVAVITVAVTPHVRTALLPPGVYTVETDTDGVFCLQGDSAVAAAATGLLSGTKLKAANPPEPFVVDGASNGYLSFIGAVASVRIVKKSETT